MLSLIVECFNPTQAYKTSWGFKCAGNIRGKLLNNLANLIEKNIEEFAALEALNGGESFSAPRSGAPLNNSHQLWLGKTYKQARTVDVPSAIGTLRYYAGWADKNHGQTLEVRARFQHYVIVTP